MKRLADAVLVNAIATAFVAIVGVRGWSLAAVCLVLLAVYLWPKGDAAARRERRIERQSDILARQLEDGHAVLRRALAKVSLDEDDRPTGIMPDDLEPSKKKVSLTG